MNSYLNYPLVNQLVDPENHQFLEETNLPGEPGGDFVWRVDVVARIQPRISGWIRMKTWLVLGQSNMDILIL
jgi:hypothetical protein